MPIPALRSIALVLWVGLIGSASAQPSRWVPLDGVRFGSEVTGIQVDQRGLMEIANHNRDDDRPYPAALVLVDFAQERDAGLLGGYRSMVLTVAIDCAKRRAQDVQTRLYAQAGGVERTSIMGTLALWSWEPDRPTDRNLSRALFARFCKP